MKNTEIGRCGAAGLTRRHRPPRPPPQRILRNLISTERPKTDKPKGCMFAAQALVEQGGQLFTAGEYGHGNPGRTGY